MKKVEELKAGQLLLVSAKRVAGEKVSLCFAQQVINPNSRPASITGLLNKSDDRFTQSANARYAWQTGMQADIEAVFGVDCSDIPNLGDEKELGILNPEIDGQKLSLQITETTDGNDYEEDNYEKTSKRAGKDGDFIMSADNKYIYTRASIVIAPAQHVFMKDTHRGVATVAGVDSAINDATA